MFSAAGAAVAAVVVAADIVVATAVSAVFNVASPNRPPN